MKDFCVVNLIAGSSDLLILPTGKFLQHWILCKYYSFYYCNAEHSSVFKLHVSYSYISARMSELIFHQQEKKKGLKIILLISMAGKHTQ